MDFNAIGAFIDKYGFPTLALIVVGWVLREIFVKAIWPYFLTTQAQNRADREQERQDRITERDLFLASLGSLNATMISRDAMLRDNMNAILTALQTVSSELTKKTNNRIKIERK